jgi:hypothetical protein
MKIDLYTKAVLTVIAASLAVIAIRSGTPEAHAQAGADPVYIVGAAANAFDQAEPIEVHMAN